MEEQRLQRDYQREEKSKDYFSSARHMKLANMHRNVANQKAHLPIRKPL